MLHKTQANQHTIFYLRHSDGEGIVRLRHKQHLIGYVLHGTMTVYTGASIQHFTKGDVFFLKAGLLYVEHLPAEGKPYEEIVVNISNELISTLVRDMGVAFGLSTTPTTSVSPKSILGEAANQALRTLFKSLHGYINTKMFDTRGSVERMKTSELFYLLFTNPHSLIRNQLSLMANKEFLNFEHIIRNNLFGDSSIEHLAAECGMSPSGFKAEFLRRYHTSPHRWIVSQKLESARILLAHTSDPVKSIAQDCGFATASHFIRHFHRTYGITPCQYRREITCRMGADCEER